MANVQTALSALYKQIRRGAEFPDACGSVATRFGVDYDDLRDAYDDECVDAADEASERGAYEGASLVCCDDTGSGEGRFHGRI